MTVTLAVLHAMFCSQRGHFGGRRAPEVENVMDG